MANNIELKNTARAILAKYRQNLLNNHPFIGTIAMNLDLVPVRDVRCKTAMTDGKSIFFDIDFLSRLNENEGVFVLGHEVWHVVMMHFLRGEGLDHSTFNVATDMEVNQILENDGFIPPVDVLFPNSNHSRKCTYNFPDGLSAEEYYELLLKKNAIDKKIGGDKSEQTSSNSKSGKSGKGGSPLEGQFDDHFNKDTNWEEAGKKAMENPSKDKYGEKGLDEDFQPGDLKNESNVKNLAEEIRQSIVSAAQTYERTRGELPGHIKKVVSAVLDSKMSWKELLAKFITSGFENKTSWNSPNRRFAWNGTYLPRHDGDMMRIAIGIDTSGSCKEDLEKFVSEIEGIAKSFGSYELHVIQCDTEVKDYQMFDEFNQIDTKAIEFKGFGGTKLKPIFDYIQLNDIEVSGVVVFTDGECENFEDDGSIDIPVMWTITGKTEERKNLKIGEQIFLK